MPSTVSPASPTVRPAVRGLVSELEAERETLADRVVERILEAIPAFGGMPRSTLRRAVVNTMTRELAALADVRAATPAELEESAAIGRERAEQGLSVESVLQAHRIAVGVVWDR